MSVPPPKPIFEQIESFVRNIATGFDCDSDAHRYNTYCRCCEAEKLLAELKGEPGCKLGNPCYRKYCLSCFCHGNIQYLSYEQAVVQSGMRVAPSCGYVPIDSEAAETLRLQEATPLMTNSRFAGCLVGLACGDALGGPAEEIPGHPSKVTKPVTEMIGGGTFHLLPGQITDDTEMALCLARSLLEKQGFDPADIAHKFQEWFFDSPIGAGGTVRAAMERLRDGYSWEEAGKSELGLKSLGNGSVMRCAPIAMFDCFAGLNERGNRLNETALLKHTLIQGIITHPREECIHAANFINVIISYLLTAREPSKEELTKAMSAGLLLVHGPRAAVPYALCWISRDMQEKYKDIHKLEKINPSGTVHNTVIASVNCLLTTNTFEEAIIKAVNLGGDADTIAAITGAMAGAWYGIEAIPERWSSKLVDRHGRPVLEELLLSAEKLHQLAKKQSLAAGAP